MIEVWDCIFVLYEAKVKSDNGSMYNMQKTFLWGQVKISFANAMF